MTTTQGPGKRYNVSLRSYAYRRSEEVSAAKKNAAKRIWTLRLTLETAGRKSPATLYDV